MPKTTKKLTKSEERIRNLALELCKELVKAGYSMKGTENMGGFDVDLLAHGKVWISNDIARWRVEFGDPATGGFVQALLYGGRVPKLTLSMEV